MAVLGTVSCEAREIDSGIHKSSANYYACSVCITGVCCQGGNDGGQRGIAAFYGCRWGYACLRHRKAGSRAGCSLRIR